MGLRGRGRGFVYGYLLYLYVATHIIRKPIVKTTRLDCYKREWYLDANLENTNPDDDYGAITNGNTEQSIY